MRYLMSCLVLIVAAVAVLYAWAPLAEPQRPSPAEAIGDPEAGRTLIAEKGCGSCHMIPGIDGARGLVGPPLDHMARRRIIAGVMQNTPANMALWVRMPQQVVPGNAMPDLGLSEAEARDITAYLYRLD